MQLCTCMFVDIIIAKTKIRLSKERWIQINKINLRVPNACNWSCRWSRWWWSGCRWINGWQLNKIIIDLVNKITNHRLDINAMKKKSISIFILSKLLDDRTGDDEPLIYHHTSITSSSFSIASLIFFFFANDNVGSSINSINNFLVSKMLLNETASNFFLRRLESLNERLTSADINSGII